ncbi:MAG: hypothetical protein LUO99_02970 [Methanomicrobiales archaeon]|nr:hypothetical protein [Methanomicrobiales archaeon]
MTRISSLPSFPVYRFSALREISLVFLNRNPLSGVFLQGAAGVPGAAPELRHPPLPRIPLTAGA